jgi:hypothetical protein
MVEIIKKEEKEIERREKIRQKLYDLREKLNECYFEIAKLLYEVWSKQYWKEWGFQTFRHYCEGELGFSLRKAQYLIAIYDYFALRIGVSTDRLVDIGWAKAKELIGVAKKEDLDYWIEKAKSLPLRELADETKKVLVSGEGQKEEKKEEEYKVTFVLMGEQYDIVKKALDKASELSKSEKSGHNLSLICMDFLSTYEKSSPLSIFEKLEKLTDLMIIAVDPKKGKIVYGDLEKLKKVR